ncbi:hypothetical protein NM688_g4124 [Phlebia brevispora]|uniref:Uncharacterized protein n=1 Tax=Phlebia brevispora TaxID=194682 RepID=A0ACC1T3Z3_9APHY|nr:hypothetical protein NM688_g4124 [Phlebia brevispora]
MSAPSPSSSASAGLSQPPQYRAVGVILAISSGVLIGSSFVFKKKGLLRSQKGHVAGEGVAYLKSPIWWTGMIIMVLGELCNFAAYAFTEAIIVTPMGALSVVISSLLSHFLLDEKLSLFGWIASLQCLLGSSILALNGPQEQSVDNIVGFRELFVTPWFLSYAGAVAAFAVFLAIWVAPRYGRKSMMPYIGICSLIGGISVSCTQGLGACILTSIRGDDQFKNWFIYLLLVVVIFTLLTEIYYLNVALALYNTAMVTPTYYVTFTFCTLLTSVILYKGLKTSASQLITVILAFVVICTGIFILQMSKVDPRQLAKVHSKVSISFGKKLIPISHVELSATRLCTLGARADPLAPGTPVFRLPHMLAVIQVPSEVGQLQDLELGNEEDGTSELDPDEKAREIVEKTEEPGLDSLRGTFGTIGTIVRARRRARALSAASANTNRRSRSSFSQHSQNQEGLRRVSTASSRPGWLTGRWSSHQGSKFEPVKEDQDGDVEKGVVTEVVEVQEEKRMDEGTSIARDQRTDSVCSSAHSPSPTDITTSPTAIPLRALQSQSTLRSVGKDTIASSETSTPMIPTLSEDDIDTK